MRKRLPERTKDAYHESGHVLLAHLEGIHFKYVTIKPDEDSLGHVLLTPYSAKFRPDLNVNAAVRKRVEALVMVDFAGKCAEEILVAGKVPKGFMSDFRDAVNIASHIHADEKVLTAYLAYLMARTEETLEMSPNWEAVETLAALLLTKETVPAKEAKAVMKDTIKLLG
jgi:ATP-dependent Zn protease